MEAGDWGDVEEEVFQLSQVSEEPHLLFPGQPLSLAQEDGRAGDGVYIRNKHLVAAQVGFEKFDDAAGTIIVRGVDDNISVVPAVGADVIALITKVSPRQVNCDVLYLATENSPRLKPHRKGRIR